MPYHSECLTKDETGLEASNQLILHYQRNFSYGQYVVRKPGFGIFQHQFRSVSQLWTEIVKNDGLVCQATTFAKHKVSQPRPVREIREK